MRLIWNKASYFLYFRLISSHLPIAVSIRRFLLSQLLGESKEGLVVRAGVFISGYQHLEIGKHVSINHGCFLSCEGGLKIGDYVAIGHGTSVMTTNHGYKDEKEPIKFQTVTYDRVHIESNVWIGANVTILAGVYIAEGTVVAAGSVVVKDISIPNTIVGGVPAKYIKNRC